MELSQNSFPDFESNPNALRALSEDTRRAIMARWIGDYQPGDNAFWSIRMRRRVRHNPEGLQLDREVRSFNPLPALWLTRRGPAPVRPVRPDVLIPGVAGSAPDRVVPSVPEVSSVSRAALTTDILRATSGPSRPTSPRAGAPVAFVNPGIRLPVLRAGGSTGLPRTSSPARQITAPSELESPAPPIASPSAGSTQANARVARAAEVEPVATDTIAAARRTPVSARAAAAAPAAVVEEEQAMGDSNNFGLIAVIAIVALMVVAS